MIVSVSNIICVFVRYWWDVFVSFFLFFDIDFLFFYLSFECLLFCFVLFCFVLFSFVFVCLYLCFVSLFFCQVDERGLLACSVQEQANDTEQSCVTAVGPLLRGTSRLTGRVAARLAKKRYQRCPAACPPGEAE